LDQLLLKTSRTFALSIPVLPAPTRTEVAVAYLLFRVADTLEDATRWPTEKMVGELQSFMRLLERPEPEEARRLSAGWLEDPPLEHAGYLELLGELPGVMQICRSLAGPADDLVRTHTRRTAELMADFVRRRGEGELQLTDLPDLRAYCYAVAGIVGEMLTELFLLERPNLISVAPQLRENAATFGEALQLVNILKDSTGDADEGRRFLPHGVDATRVFALARDDLAAAGHYVGLMQQAGAERGLIEFCALPVLLAWATLDRVERDGPGAKLTRLEVAAIVADLGVALEAGRPAIARS
jgi:farnesyl-diphosphate farnesyltransferase